MRINIKFLNADHFPHIDKLYFEDKTWREVEYCRMRVKEKFPFPIVDKSKRPYVITLALADRERAAKEKVYAYTYITVRSFNLKGEALDGGPNITGWSLYTNADHEEAMGLLDDLNSGSPPGCGPFY